MNTLVWSCIVLLLLVGVVSGHVVINYVPDKTFDITLDGVKVQQVMTDSLGIMYYELECIDNPPCTIGFAPMGEHVATIPNCGARR